MIIMSISTVGIKPVNHRRTSQKSRLSNTLTDAIFQQRTEMNWSRMDESRIYIAGCLVAIDFGVTHNFLIDWLIVFRLKCFIEIWNTPLLAVSLNIITTTNLSSNYTWKQHSLPNPPTLSHPKFLSSKRRIKRGFTTLVILLKKVIKDKSLHPYNHSYKQSHPKSK